MKNILFLLSVWIAYSSSLAGDWQQAVKAEPPVAPAGQTQTFANTVSTAPLFYSAAREIPPLPFNPHPEYDLYDLGDNRFMYDDTESVTWGGGEMMTMAPPSPCDPCSTNGNGGESQSFTGPPAYSYSGSNLWVKITKTSPSNNFRLDVMNTVSGTTYGVLAKSVMDNEPFNTWTLVNVFQATSTNQTLFGTAAAATRFYSAVNLDVYTGPTVTIVSPIAGTTVSNDVTLQVRVADILPLAGLNVYVDGTQVGVIQSNQNGIIRVPTYFFPNGSHQIWVAAANTGIPVDTDGNGVADDSNSFNGGAGVTVKFTNDIAMVNYSPLYSKMGSLSLQYTVKTAQNFKFEVLLTNGTVLYTTNGASSNGSIAPQWGITDLSGNAVSNGVYVFSLSATQASSGTAKKLLSTNFIDNGLSVGKYIISYGEGPSTSFNEALADMNASVSIGINIAGMFSDDIIGPNRENYNPVYVDFHSDPFAIKQNTQTNDLTALTNALKSPVVGSWLFQGHSGPTDIIPGDDLHLLVRVNAQQVAKLLGNAYGFSTGSVFHAKYDRRLFSTMLTGCKAAMTTSEWPDATGTPPGVDQENNSQIRKSVFVGFSNVSYANSSKVGWIDRVHYEWIDGDEYDTEISTAVWRAGLVYTEVQSWGPAIFGHSFLGYNALESR